MVCAVAGHMFQYARQPVTPHIQNMWMQIMYLYAIAELEGSLGWYFFISQSLDESHWARDLDVARPLVEKLHFLCVHFARDRALVERKSACVHMLARFVEFMSVESWDEVVAETSLGKSYSSFFPGCRAYHSCLG